MSLKVRKAVIAAAGLGTRFLPQTKAMPKEMLPVIDKPIIQWIVEELVEVGVTDIIIVTGAQKRAIEDHFDRSVELEEALIKKGKTKEAEIIKNIAELANFIYIRQKGRPAGTARPILNAAHLIGDEPFFYLSADDLVFSEGKSRSKQLLEAHEMTGKSILSMFEIDKSDSEKYGMVDLGQSIENGLYKLKGVVEKPVPSRSPSNYMTIMSYLLTPDFIQHVEKLKPSVGGEIIAAEAFSSLIKDDDVYGKVIDGEYHDCGNYSSYLKAVIRYASDHPDTDSELKDYIKSIG